MSRSITTARTIPFLDLGAMHDEVWDEVDRSWASVTRDGAFIGGERVAEFERSWAAYCGVDHAVGVGNGTDALVIALRALGIGPGADVVVPANTFVATAEAVALTGARPLFVDVDPDTLLLDLDQVQDRLTAGADAVIVVHLYGQLPDMEALVALTTAAGVPLVEDAAQAHGARFRGRRAGSFGAVGCFSFYPGKNLGAFGDAGAAVTDDPDLAARMRSIANHGRSPDSKHEHPLLGTNSRLDGLQAPVLSAKLRHLEGWNAGRVRAASHYRSRLEASSVRLTDTHPDVDGAYHLQVVRVDDRDEVRNRLATRGIGTGIHYPVPCHLQLPYADGSELPVSEAAARQVLSLPMFPHLDVPAVDYVCDVLLETLDELADTP